MTNTALLITLGHHASAIYYDGTKAIGYEEERLNRKKATSDYPRKALKLIEEQCEIAPGSRILVSHWFDVFGPQAIPDGKYFDRTHFEDLVERYDLRPEFVSDHCAEFRAGAGQSRLTSAVTPVSSFTHHDAHAWSVLSFFRDKVTTKNLELVDTDDTVHVVVVDGFGNWQEVLSVYEMPASGVVAGGDLRLVRRVWGYERSMGLMYQFATSYCGMKENQDEYKFLGYESHIGETLDEQTREKLREAAAIQEAEVFQSFLGNDLVMAKPSSHNSTGEGMIDLNDLGAARETWHKRFDEVLASLNIDPDSIDSREKRVIVGTFVQMIVENVLVKVVSGLGVKHLLVAGGVFYNVKLNNRLLKQIPGLFSVIPLAGDQGCGIGMYEYFVGQFKFGDLKWGTRESFSGWRDVMSQEDFDMCKDYIEHFDDRNDFTTAVTNSLANGEIVNIVTGPMEFGPRALCSTTTLAKPTKKNVERINTLNDRDTVMPMAPVMPVSEAANYFEPELYERVVGSDRYMIVTYDYLGGSGEITDYDGVTHAYPVMSDYSGRFSGRPQFVNNDDPVMSGIFDKVEGRKILINTSFNAHGRPIVFNVDSVLDSYVFQVRKAKDLGLRPPLLYLCDHYPGDGDGE